MKKSITLKRIFVLLLMFSIVFSGNGINVKTVKAADELVPGTQQYYQARWEDAKVKAGNLSAGTSYTTYLGNNDTTKVEGPWMVENLKEKYDNGDISAPWDGTAVMPTKTDNGGAYDAASNPWKVYTAEELRWVMTNHQSFKLQNDIDLGGYLGKVWTTPATASNTWTADGNGYTVYNYYCNTASSYTSMFGASSNINIADLRVANAYGNYSAASEHAIIISGASSVKIIDCAVEDTMMYCNTPGVWVNSIIANRCNEITIENTYTKNSHIATLARSSYSCCCQIIEGCTNPIVKNTYAIDGSVVGDGGHNGGFMSCNFGLAEIENCFSNIDVYGNTTAGVFMGVSHGATNFKNCFTTGKIEGTNSLGGFAGPVDSVAGSAPYNQSFENCYSTALVGIVGKPINVGGFFATDTGHAISLKNCYTAGEVGNISTVVDSTTAPGNTGGFTGTYNASRFTFENCYYDKQTTGMKEWAIGNMTSDQMSNNGLKGVLTTTSEKSGAGLTSAPGNNGFTGFGSDDDKWTYEEGYYPQLKVFTNPTTFTNTNWMSEEDLHNTIKAYSKASASTVKLNTYDEDYAGNKLSKETYDTVRDVTSKFPLSSDEGIEWKRCGVTGQGTLATGEGAKSYAFVTGDNDVMSDVINLYNEEGTWYGNNPMPGIDWLRVNAKEGNITGTRQLRICPTVGLSAGLSKNIGANTYYDHADDVRLVYSTGARMAANSKDFTYGVYPDNPLEQSQKDILNTSAYANVSALENKYTQSGQNDAFGDIDVLHMERTGTALDSGVPAITASETGAKINEVNIYEISAENSDGSVNAKTKVNLENTENQNKWNGKDFFATDGKDHKYSVEYVWSLADGRYVRDTKRIESTPVTHSATVEVQTPSGNPYPGQAYLDVYSKSDENGAVDSGIKEDFGSSTKVKDELESQPYGHPAEVAWKWVDGANSLIGCDITFTSSDKLTSNKVTLKPSDIPTTPGESKSFKVETPYRSYSYDNNGNIVWQQTNVEKTYSIQLGNDGVYRLTFDVEEKDYGDGVYIDDLDFNVAVVLKVEIQSATISGDTIKVQKDFSGRENDEWYNTDKFSFKLEGADEKTKEAIKNGGIVLPESSKGLTIGKNTENKEAVFGDIVFKSEGEYTFAVSEILPEGVNKDNPQKNSIKYDTTIRYINVSVKLEGSKYVATIKKADSLIFHNEFIPNKGSIGTGEISGQKQVESVDDSFTFKGDDFKFYMYGVSAVDKNYQEIKSWDNEKIEVTNDENGNIIFPERRFDQEGTYTYVIGESGKETSVGIDQDESLLIVTYKVTYDKEANKLTYTRTITKNNAEQDDITFINKHDPNLSEISVDVNGIKVLTGRALKENEFTFELKALNGAPLPQNTQVKNNKDGSFTFGNIVFDREGVYEYEITEKVEDLSGVEYDKSVCKVIITVTEQKGVLKATVEYKKDEEDVDNVYFLNKFDIDGQTDVDIDGDGNPDINVDTDGDGNPDINIDTDNDGDPDINIDTDGDKNPDINIDVDGDKIPDINIDTDTDKKPDINIDTNGDKKPDINIDTDNTGTWKPSGEGGNGDGIWKPDTDLDTNGDGKVDIDHSYRPGYDNDKDGVDDNWKPDKDVDLDGDKIPDYDTSHPNINVDTDGDGNPDINIDTDNDGDPDINIDTDGDGNPDINIDTNGDGKPDKNIDKDGDGKVDPETGSSNDSEKDSASVDTSDNNNVNMYIFIALASIVALSGTCLILRKKFNN